MFNYLLFIQIMLVLDIFLLVLALCLLVAGLLGCILPVIPGPPLSYVALLILQITRFASFSVKFLLITAAITVIITLLDYFLPVWGTKKFGGSRAGTIGSIAGLLLGLFFAPLGIIIGPFAGAVAGELITGRDKNSALRSGFGSFIGFVVGVAMKFAICIALTYYFIKEFIT